MIVVKYRWLHIPTKKNGEKSFCFQSYRDAIKTICSWNKQQEDVWAYIILDVKTIDSEEQSVGKTINFDRNIVTLKLAG
jgi:hypothetical protein